MNRILTTISAPLLIGSILALGALALPVPADAEEGTRFVFRYSSAVLPPTQVATAAPDSDEEAAEADDATLASLLRLSTLSVTAPSEISFVSGGVFEVAFEIKNNGESVAHAPEISVAFVPWGTAETTCFDTESILPGESGFCVARLAVTDNGQILALGRRPGEQSVIPITATLAGQSASAEAVVTVGSHFVPRFTASLVFPDTTQRTIVDEVPVLMSTEAELITLPMDEAIPDEYLPSANGNEVGWHEHRRIGLLDGGELGEADMYISRRESGGWEIAFFRYDGNGFPYASAPLKVIRIPEG